MILYKYLNFIDFDYFTVIPSPHQKKKNSNLVKVTVLSSIGLTTVNFYQDYIFWIKSCSLSKFAANQCWRTQLSYYLTNTWMGGGGEEDTCVKVNVTKLDWILPRITNFLYSLYILTYSQDHSPCNSVF